MSITPHKRIRAAESEGGLPSTLVNEYRMCVPTGALTLANAATTTAGHIFVMRNPSATVKVNIRYLKVNWVMTTAFGSAQNMGVDVIAARTFTASYTGGTAIDMGSTLIANKVRANAATSVFTANTCRVATTGDLTVGTQTLDANALARDQTYMGTTLGSGASATWTLWDARDDGSSVVRSPITLGQNEGIVVRNTVLMGATGVGTALFTVEWDELTL